jgi:AMP-polyphosphate phosphotransferase
MIILGKHFLSWYCATWYSGQLCSGAAGMTSAVKVKSGFKLADLDLDRRLADETSYLQKLRKLQIAMLELEEIYRVERRRGIILLEGWDAAGKSGAIQRLIERLDPRWVSVWPIGPPTPEEQGRHYLWRFWQRLPLPGQIAIFDRSWYGRLLVERVEALARPKEWRRAYDEINAFERMLVDDGVRLVKLFFHISEEEQLRRFRERITTPAKHWKISADDIRNRARRPDYLDALDDMFALTSTVVAPWHVVPAEFKWFARVAMAHSVVKALSKGLALGPPALDPEVARAAAEYLGRKERTALGLAMPKQTVS